MTKLNTTRLSMEHLENAGYTCEVVEYHMRHGGRTRDLFNCLDILALKEADGTTVGVQTTSFPNRCDRIRKIEDTGLLPVFSACGWGICVHGWRNNDEVEVTWLLRPKHHSKGLL